MPIRKKRHSYTGTFHVDYNSYNYIHSFKKYNQSFEKQSVALCSNRVFLPYVSIRNNHCSIMQLLFYAQPPFIAFVVYYIRILFKIKGNVLKSWDHLESYIKG